MECDSKFVGGEVVDGTGSRAFRADVAVVGDRIVAVGDLTEVQAAREINCSGRTLTPGFIDIHSHSDWLVPNGDHGRTIEPFIRQGMTSLVAGNCGFSPAPVSSRNERASAEAGRLIVDESPKLDWRTMDEYLTTLETRGLALNVAELVGTRRGAGRRERASNLCRAHA